MVSVIFSESIILISSIVLAAAFSGIILSKTGLLESVFTSITSRQKEVMLTDVKIIYVTNINSTSVKAWIKNIGSAPIIDLDSVDIYFGRINSAMLIPYNAISTPRWIYSDTSIWKQTDTKEIIINTGSTIANDVYLLKIITPNGVSDEYIFTPL